MRRVASRLRREDQQPKMERDIFASGVASRAISGVSFAQPRILHDLGRCATAVAGKIGEIRGIDFPIILQGGPNG